MWFDVCNGQFLNFKNSKDRFTFSCSQLAAVYARLVAFPKLKGIPSRNHPTFGCLFLRTRRKFRFPFLLRHGPAFTLGALKKSYE